MRHDLPVRYYRTLPKLAAREFSGQARIHALALELIRHSDGRLDAERLTRFVLAFQTVAPLTIGELWALPSMLKLALLENLRLLTDGILAGRTARLAADAPSRDWRRRPPPERCPSRSRAPSWRSFGSGCASTTPRVSALAAAVEAALAARGTTPEDAVRAENQRQATDQVSTGNTVTSLQVLRDARLELASWSRSARGGDPAAGPGRGLPADGLRQPRPLPPRRRGSRGRRPQGRAGEAQVGSPCAPSRAPAGPRSGWASAEARLTSATHLIGPGRRDLEIDVAYRPRLARAAPPLLPALTPRRSTSAASVS